MRKKILYFIRWHSQIIMSEDKSRTPDEMLDDARDGAAANMNGKVTGEEIISLKNCPGREIKYSGPKNMAIKSKIFLCSNRFYDVTVVAMPDNIFDKKVINFLDSFNIE